MTPTEELLARQAAWQKSRRALSWPEKIRQVEQVRSAVEEMRTLRQERRHQQEQSAGNGEPATPSRSA